jgi:hypothetical protein
MLRSAKIPPVLRRMTLEELLAKLQQIEQQAALTLDEYPHGLTVERQRLIIGLARQIQARLREADPPREVPVLQAAG